MSSFLKTNAGLATVALLSLVIGFFFGMEYKSYQIRSALAEFSSAVSSGISDSSTSSETQPEEKKEPIEKQIGDAIELPTFTYTVESSEETDMLNTSYGEPVPAKENTKFIIVHLKVTNTTNQEFAFSPDKYFRLINNESKEYSVYEEYVSYNANLKYKGLKPDIQEEGVLIYEVPSDMNQYLFLGSDENRTQGYIVILKK